MKDMREIIKTIRGNRDRSSKAFLFDHQIFNTMEREVYDEIIKSVLCTEELVKKKDYHWDEVDNINEIDLVRYKRFHLSNTYYRYTRIINLCCVLGVENVYDIGCECINQGLMLLKYFNISYVGIEANQFYLNDYRLIDKIENNYFYPVVDTPPAPFCEGRISYIKSEYPFELETKRNNLGVALSSLAPHSQIEANLLVEYLTNQFDRVIISVARSNVHLWRNADWGQMDIQIIGRDGVILGTKNKEDIDRLKMIYPYNNNYIDVGIMAFEEYNSPFVEEESYYSENNIWE